ncbi:hypothetical protein Selli2_02920 [Sellimonas catena]|uniref:Uncharacterized protein n=1 Tax=Sellimonas catena TaxID=2994035 RepID=A0A9W6FEH2_9FIRM|nr:hypothetical protein Selli2_02920 [Sellimonas catena]
MQVEGLSAVPPKTLTPDFPIPGKYRLTCEGKLRFPSTPSFLQDSGHNLFPVPHP